jgi:hypothetical protein
VTANVETKKRSRSFFMRVSQAQPGNPSIRRKTCPGNYVCSAPTGRSCPKVVHFPSEES